MVRPSLFGTGAVLTHVEHLGMGLRFWSARFF